MHDFYHALMSATGLALSGRRSWRHAWFQTVPDVRNWLMSVTGLLILDKELAPCMISIMP